MKKMFLFVLLAVVSLVAVCSGADPAPVAAAAPVVAEPSAVQKVINFILANQIIIAMLIVAVLDFVFAINPNWQSNGVLHGLYTMAKGKTQPPA